jgi:hypothetical protein
LELRELSQWAEERVGGRLTSASCCRSC